MSQKMNAIKSEQLGMNIGTASSQLKKRIMFKLLQRLGEDFCYQCKERIESVDDLSVEHKVAWLHVSPDLFWDLDNIAFSHLSCNIKAANRPLDRRKYASEGTAWCSRCKAYLPLSSFNLWKNGIKGVKNDCIECSTIKMAEYRRQEKCSYSPTAEASSSNGEKV